MKIEYNGLYFEDIETGDVYEYDEILDDVNQVPVYREKIKELENKLEITIDALNEIYNPIGYIEMRLKENEKLNVLMAMQLADSGFYLRDIANKTLKNLEKEYKETYFKKIVINK